MHASTRHLQILYGLAAADALGAATEFQSPAQVARRFPNGLKEYTSGSPFGFSPGEATDDTQMTIATLCGLTSGTRDPDEVLRHFLDWLSHSPLDVGNLTRSALRRAMTEAGRSGGMNAWVKGGMDNAGNGGLMRVAGVYLAGLRGVELTDAAITVTALTHADPCCILASIFMVKLLEQLDSHRLPYKEAADVAWESTEEAERVVSVLEAESFFSDTTMTPEGYVKLLRKALRKVGERVDAGVAGVKQKQTGYVLDTLQAALALQHGATSWMEVAEGAALAGDDSDTVGCVAGAIAGAQGFEVPAELLVDLRVGASWGDWQQEWPSERLEGLL